MTASATLVRPGRVHACPGWTTKCSGDWYDDSAYHESAPVEVGVPPERATEGVPSVYLSSVDDPDGNRAVPTVDLIIGSGSAVSLSPSEALQLAAVLQRHAAIVTSAQEATR